MTKNLAPALPPKTSTTTPAKPSTSKPGQLATGTAPPRPSTNKPGQVAANKIFGIGVQVTRDAHALRIDAVMSGGGAAAAKMVVGDRVIAIDGIAVATLAPDQTQARMLGEAGTSVTLTLQRNGAPVILVVERTTSGMKKKLSLDISDMSEVLERKISP